MDSSREELALEVHKMAVEKGWWDNPLDQRVHRLLDWIIEEVEEAREAWDEAAKLSWFSTDSEGLLKPEGIASELADIDLILGDLALGLGIDLTAAGRLKLDYNHVRKYKRDKAGNPL